jgi:hypothetical protein
MWGRLASVLKILFPPNSHKWQIPCITPFALFAALLRPDAHSHSSSWHFCLLVVPRRFQ